MSSVSVNGPKHASPLAACGNPRLTTVEHKHACLPRTPMIIKGNHIQ